MSDPTATHPSSPEPTPLPSDAAPVTAPLTEPPPSTVPPPPNDQGGALAVKVEAPVPFEPRDTAEMFRFSRFLAMSELVPKPLRGRPYDVLLVLLKGHSLGLVDPMISIGNIHVVDGKAELSAALMMSLVRKSGLCDYWQLIESTDEIATYETQRKGDPAPCRMSYTIRMADRAGLAGKDNWRKMPEIMLARRCQARLAREVYPEICVGLYDEGELSEMRGELDAPEAAWRAKVAPIAIEVGVTETPALPSGGKRDPMKERLASRKVEREKEPVTAGTAPLFGRKDDPDTEPPWMARGDYPKDK